MTRRFQFSLRALLVVTTCACIWLAWQVREIARQRRAIATIEAMGGMVRGFYDQEPGVGYREPLRDDFLFVAFVQLSPREPIAITDDGLRQLAGLRNLKILTFFNVPITDANLRQLHCLKNLHFLDLNHTRVTAAGVAELKQALPECRIDCSPPL